MRASPLAARATGLLAAVTLSAGAEVAVAQQTTEALIFGGALGDLRQAETANPGRIHVAGNLGAASADYFRGGFDDVPSDLDEIAIGPDLSVMVELWQDQPWPVGDLSLTLGSQNNFADPVQPTDSSVENWYESNNFVALTAGLGEDWLAGLTYTLYSSPNDVSGRAHEIAFAGAYRGADPLGDLGPQLKIAKPTDRGGVYGELVAAPGIDLFENAAWPLSLSLPLTLGIGFDDYYGAETGTTGFVAVGLAGSVPLGFMPSDYGSWRLSAGVDLILREEDIVDAGGPFDDAGNLVPIGSLTISFVY